MLDKRYCAVIVDNRLTNHLFDTIQKHRNMLPEWWSCCHIDDPTIKTAADYNRLLTSKEFWNKFKKFDRVLIFQHDSMLLRYGIDEFLKWDFIGAPLYHIPFPAMNGGLSLRNPKKMLKCIADWPYRGMNEHGNEDVYFCAWLNTHGKLPDIETAKSFSVETVFHPKPLGYHAMAKYLTPEECNLILNG